jgi:hypothetical protein
MAGGKLKISSALAGPMTVDLSAVRTIVLPDEKSLPLEVLKEFAALNLSKASQDYLLAVDKKGQAAPYAGIFKGISGGKVSFELDGAERTIDLASVRLIELANTLGGEKPRGEIILTDGSAIPFAQIALGSGRWTIGHPRLSVSPLEEAKVAEVRIFSDKLAYLSDLQPVRQEQVGMFDAGVGFVRDRSTTGGPIRLGGVTYSRGLGLHSRCVLTYQLDGKYSTFLAKAGIDDAAARAGKAVLTVSADGKKLLDAQALSADQSGMDLRLDVKGAKELTILVEFPPDGLDVGGHVDLADAILVQ